MLRRIDRYLLTELLASFAASTVVLLLVTLGGVLADVLNKIARGKIPADLLFSLVGLRSLEALTVLLPLAAFLAVMLAYGRLYRDSEMAVLSASGLSLRGLLRPLLVLAALIVLLLSTLALWLAPAATGLAQRLLDEANRSLIVVGLEAGRFVELPGKVGVVYVAELSDSATHFNRLFIARERDGRIDVATAEAGELFREGQGETRYLSLQEGFRVEGALGQDDFRMMRFARNDIRLPDAEAEPDDGRRRSSPSLDLLRSGEPADRAELHWRIGAPLSALLLMLLAAPMARTAPRAPRYGRLLIAIFSYLIYANCLALGRGWMAEEQLPAEIGLWWVHIPVLLVALVLLARSDRMPRRSGRRA